MKYSTWLIVTITLAIPVLPVLMQQVPAEISRWYMAAAVNALDFEEGDPEIYLESARKWQQDLPNRLDYWVFRIVSAAKLKPDEVPGVLREADQHIEATEGLYLYAAQSLLKRSHLNECLQLMREASETADLPYVVYAQIALLVMEDSEFEAAIELLELSNIQRELGDAVYLSHLNQLAYLRALNGRDLDQALEEIELALANTPASESATRAAFLDTRAWVLFGLERYPEALLDINKSISLETVGLVAWLGTIMGVDSSSNKTDSRSAEPGDTEAELADGLDADSMAASPAKELTSDQAAQRDSKARRLGPLYYHRAMILKAMGRDKAAERDFQWLRDNGLATDGSLF